MFSKQDIADYYNTTQNHYEKWWNLKKNLSLHYGIWDNNTKNFNESLINTNRTLLNIAQIDGHEKVLDAGCGVGGAAFFLNREKGNDVTGISLSDKQVNFANSISQERKVESKVRFYVIDYTNTPFDDESFDIIWACESVSSIPDKSLFIKEAFRLLKKGGKLILADFFMTVKNQHDPKSWIKKWGATWGISNFSTIDDFTNELNSVGFTSSNHYDYTDQIRRSAKRMYHASILGFIPSETYNLFHPKVSRFAKHHYRCGYYQYKALKKGLWRYGIIKAEK